MSYVDKLDINGVSYDIKSVAVRDTNSGMVLKIWTGTKEEYDSIENKDITTLYNTDKGLFLGDSVVANISTDSSSRNIGEIVASTVPLVDAGLHLLDGALIQGSGIYSAFVNYIADLYDSGDYLDIFTTESDWQSTVTQYGVCGKFVYTPSYYYCWKGNYLGTDIKVYTTTLTPPTDNTYYVFTESDGVLVESTDTVTQLGTTAGVGEYIKISNSNYLSVYFYRSESDDTPTVRLPKITGIIEGTTDLKALGDLVEAGLPNITGQFALKGTEGSFSVSGAFYAGSKTGSWGGGHVDDQKPPLMYFNASRSSSIYGNSSTVQPQTIKVLYYIVIGTSVKTDIQVDIDNITTDLNGKADTDLLNVPESRGILVEKSSKDILPRWYRVYADGWCEQGGSFTCSSAGQTLTYLKPFIDTNYTMTAAGGTNKFGTIAFYNRTTTQCACWISDDDSFNAGVIDWQACGYIR
jgi:hypothetical protein